MAQALLETEIELRIVEFDVLRELYPPIEGDTVYLLQMDGVLENFKLTDARPGITSGWDVATNKYQQTRELRIATTEDDFWQVLLKSSHAAIGSHVFNIDRASAMPPSRRYPYYTVAIEASGETYTP